MLVSSLISPSSNTTISVLPPPISITIPFSTSYSLFTAKNPNLASSSPNNISGSIPVLAFISCNASSLFFIFLKDAVAKTEYTFT